MPVETVREGSRWRYKKPSSEEVGAWFNDVPLDEGMDHAQYVSGVVLIPAQEKVKVQREDERGTEDIYEMTFTPYVRVDTRIAYFRALAAKNEQIAVIEPVAVPVLEQPDLLRNDNMPPGFWWHIVQRDSNHVKFLCCTMRVALYEQDAWFASDDGKLPRATREGVATKQVVQATQSGVDVNMLAKAETGAVGRALGMAGILVIGTGIATAEDMQEVREAAPAPELPEAGATMEDINERLMELQGRMTSEAPGRWQEFSAWWTERQQREGWKTLNDAPIEVRRGMVQRMEKMLEEGDPPQDRSSGK